MEPEIVQDKQEPEIEEIEQEKKAGISKYLLPLGAGLAALSFLLG